MVPGWVKSPGSRPGDPGGMNVGGVSASKGHSLFIYSFIYIFLFMYLFVCLFIYPTFLPYEAPELILTWATVHLDLGRVKLPQSSTSQSHADFTRRAFGFRV